MKRKLYIAHHQNDGPVSVILAPSREHADIFWNGLGLYASKVEEIDSDDDEAFAVIAVVGIRNQRISDLRDSRRSALDHLHIMVRGRGEEPR